MLAYMIEGEAGAYHRTLSDELARRFKLTPVGERIGPHVTLKAPFTTNDPTELREIEHLLTSFTAKESPQSVTLGGVGTFRNRVVYMDAHAPKQTHMLVRRLQDKLRNVPWLTFSSNEFPLDLHATLCYAKHPQQGKEIISHLEKQKLDTFELSFDHIALLRKDGALWERKDTYPLTE